MVAEAHLALSTLFLKENQELWYVCFPTAESAREIPTLLPLSASTYRVEQFSALGDAEKNAIVPCKDQLQSALEKLFCGSDIPVVHNASFWCDFFHTLQFELAEGLVVHRDRTCNEAEVSSQLMQPLIRRIAHSAQTISVPNGYTSTRIVTTDERDGRRGRRPQVDYTMSAQISSEGIPRSSVLCPCRSQTTCGTPEHSAACAVPGFIGNRTIDARQSWCRPVA